MYGNVGMLRIEYIIFVMLTPTDELTTTVKELTAIKTKARQYYITTSSGSSTTEEEDGSGSNSTTATA